MRYCLVHKTSRCVVPLFCKSELIDWIRTHSFCLTYGSILNWSVHRMRMYRRGTHGHYLVLAGDYICSLHQYIVKHKLM